MPSVCSTHRKIMAEPVSGRGRVGIPMGVEILGRGQVGHF